MNILVTGSSGFVGSHLCEHFFLRGFKVTGISRSKGYLENVDGVKWVKCNLTSASDLEVLADLDFDVVIHNAGLTFTRRPDKYWIVNVYSTYNLVRFLERINFKGKFVYISSLAASGPGVRKESDPEEPIVSYGISKLYAERLIKNSNLDWLIVRPPVIFGERDEKLSPIYSMFKKGIGIKWYPEKKLSIVYVKNVAKAVDFLVEKDAKGIFFVKDIDITWDELARKFFEIINPPRRILVPVHNSLLYPIFAISRAIYVLSGRDVLLSEDKFKEIRENAWIADDSKLREMGFTPEFEFNEALLRTWIWVSEFLKL